MLQKSSYPPSFLGNIVIYCPSEKQNKKGQGNPCLETLGRNYSHAQVIPKCVTFNNFFVLKHPVGFF